MKALIAFVITLLVGLNTATAAEEAATFHNIKLGTQLDSQFQKCIENLKYLYSPYKDDKGNTIPCLYDISLFRSAPYPQLETVELVESLATLPPEALPGVPLVYLKVLVPASMELDDGTIEGVMLSYVPLESERVNSALVEKFGASHPPEKKIDPKLLQALFGTTNISREVWNTVWGELFLGVSDKDVIVAAETSKLISFEREQNQKKGDEF